MSDFFLLHAKREVPSLSIQPEKSTEFFQMNQSENASGPSNYVNQQLNDLNQESNYINQVSVRPNNYAALQGIDSSRNEYEQLNK